GASGAELSGSVSTYGCRVRMIDTGALSTCACPPSAANDASTVTPVTVWFPWFTMCPSTYVDRPPDKLSDWLGCRLVSSRFAAYAAPPVAPDLCRPTASHATTMMTTTTAAIETAAVGKLFSRTGSLNKGSVCDSRESFGSGEIFVGSGITSDSILHQILQELFGFGLILGRASAAPLEYLGTRSLMSKHASSASLRLCQPRAPIPGTLEERRRDYAETLHREAPILIRSELRRIRPAGSTPDNLFN